MTITMIAFISTVLFLVPAFVLPHNQLRAIICSFIPGFLLLSILHFCDLFITTINLNESMGKFFSPMWKPLFEGFEELSLAEEIHISTSFSYLFIYIVCFIICYSIISYFFIGSNPSVRRPIKTIHRAFDILFLFGFTYAVWFFFLAEIRLIIPFPDGFLWPLYQWIYPIEV